METLVETVNDAPRIVDFTALDRCDSCGAQAQMRAELGSGELLFCAHHGRRSFAKLATVAKLEYGSENAFILITN